MARRTSQGSWMGVALPSGTAQPDLPPVEAWGKSNLDQRPTKSRSPNGEWSSTLPSPRRSAQLIRATRWLVVRPSRLRPVMDAPRPWPSTRLRIAFLRLPQRYRYRRCPYLSYGPPRSRPEHGAPITEIRSSERIRQNPWVCNRRYSGRYSTCLDVSPLTHPIPEDLVADARR